MKKVFIFVVSLFLFFTMVSNAANYVVQKEAPEWYTTQYWIVTFTFGSFPFGEKVRDENDNIKQALGVYSNYKKLEIMRIQQKDGKDHVDLAYLENGEVKWRPLKGRYSFLAFEHNPGSLFGSFFFEYEITRGDGLPPAKGYVAGNMPRFSYDKTRQRWTASSASGYAVFFNEPQDFPAWHLMSPATDVSSSSIVGVPAMVNVAIFGYQTGAQIKRTIEDAARDFANPRRK